MLIEQPEPAAPAQPVLVMRGIEKAFPGVKALRGAQLELVPGEVHALMGENGAGKSTLIKVLAGAHQPDAGEIIVGGQPVEFRGPSDAEAHGVAVIYQEFNLVPMLTARENIFLGRESTHLGFVSSRSEREQALALFRRMNVDVDPEARVDELSVAQQQVVEIAKALVMDARIIVMDEPTAALTDQEVEKLFAIICDLKARGVAVVYVSHRLDEVFAICDRATVMRDGQYVGTKRIADLSRRELIEMMVGRRLEQEFPKRQPKLGEVLLKVEGLGREGAVEPASFELRRGEVLSLTGLVGAGRTELVRLIFGADRADRGTVTLRGEPLKIRSPRDAIRHGICLLTEDRKGQGLVLNHAVRENFGLPNLKLFSRLTFLRQRQESKAFADYVSSLRIKISDHDQLARNLSGGNQQKVVLAKWLQRHSEVLIFDEPTRGIDVGAKFEIYQLMNALVAEGKAIIMISSELPEVLGMSDRILVMHEGRIVGEIDDVSKATQAQIMHMAVGGSPATHAA